MDLYERLFVLFTQRNSLGEKSASFSRLYCAIFVQEVIIPFKRRLFLILIFIMFVTVMLCGYVKYYNNNNIIIIIHTR